MCVCFNIFLPDLWPLPLPSHSGDHSQMWQTFHTAAIPPTMVKHVIISSKYTPAIYVTPTDIGSKSHEWSLRDSATVTCIHCGHPHRHYWKRSQHSHLMHRSVLQWLGVTCVVAVISLLSHGKTPFYLPFHPSTTLLSLSSRAVWRVYFKALRERMWQQWDLH